MAQHADKRQRQNFVRKKFLKLSSKFPENVLYSKKKEGGFFRSRSQDVLPCCMNNACGRLMQY